MAQINKELYNLNGYDVDPEDIEDISHALAQILEKSLLYGQKSAKAGVAKHEMEHTTERIRESKGPGYTLAILRYLLGVSDE